MEWGPALVIFLTSVALALWYGVQLDSMRRKLESSEAECLLLSEQLARAIDRLSTLSAIQILAQSCDGGLIGVMVKPVADAILAAKEKPFVEAVTELRAKLAEAGVVVRPGDWNKDE